MKYPAYTNRAAAPLMTIMSFDKVEYTSEEPRTYGEQFRDPGRAADRQDQPRTIKMRGAYGRHPQHSRMVQLHIHPTSRGLDHLCPLIEKNPYQRAHLRLTLENDSQRTVDIALFSA
ncbi:hypothetical protein CUN61_27255 [Pseudomonas arsenicoxydans]|uniref:Uncharacterized protein n=1 Tax=Pseudomonas arsenicoxydans TaxID=702115 RepID=A0A4V0YKK0_9PSED|nr:hypothetical protein CUN61_27255 [Pseudomonas arsenicoxydans]